MSEVERSQKRGLSAIMFTDMVGYTTITERDENKALRLLEEHRSLLKGIFPKYEGVIVKTIGDAFLVEFASAVEAVNCALETQSEIRRLNEGRGQNEKVTIRVGIHVGDIVHSAGDILGDAVNVASRVEQFAEPGGICVTRQVVDQVRGKVQCQLVSLGTRELKNIRNPVELYRVMSMATSKFENEALDPRRVAILPLTNMSPDPNDKYFADGMTEELISRVSKIGELGVISRTSIMRYRDTTVPLGQIGQELGVGSVLEGSLRKAGNRVRITAQLVDVKSDRHLWSESYDRDLDDIFAIQSDIAQQVADALKVQLLTRERQGIQRKATESVDAYTLYLKGRYYWNERTEEGTKTASRYFEEATKKDPKFALAYVGLADCYNIFSDYGWMRPSEALPKAKSFAMKALEINDKLAEAHASLGLALYNRDWDFDAAEREFKRAIELNPNYATAHQWYGIFLVFMRRDLEAYDRVKRASELDPLSPIISVNLGNVMFQLGRRTEAIELNKKAIEASPNFAPAHFWLSLAYLQSSMLEKAEEEMRKAINLAPETQDWKAILGFIYRVSGRPSDAKRIFEEVISQSKRVYTSPVGMATAYFAVGEDDKAFGWLEKAYSERSPDLLYFAIFWWAEKIRSDPRWLSLERKMGLKRPR